MSKNDTAQLTRADVKKAYKLVERLATLTSLLAGLSLGLIVITLSDMSSRTANSGDSILLLLGVGIFILALSVLVISYQAMKVLDDENDEEKEA